MWWHPVHSVVEVQQVQCHHLEEVQHRHDHVEGGPNQDVEKQVVQLHLELQEGCPCEVVEDGSHSQQVHREVLLMIEILHDLKDPKLGELWYNPYYG